MSSLRNLADGLRSLFRKEKSVRNLDEELDGFLEMAIEEKMKEGMSRQEAGRTARLERGSFEVAKELVGSTGWESFVETIWQDLRFGLRMFRKNPGSRRWPSSRWLSALAPTRRFSQSSRRAAESPPLSAS
jgi:hypothetical protein